MQVEETKIKNRWCQIGAPELQQELPEGCFTGLSRPLLVNAPFEYRNSASVWCVVPSLTSWASGHETGGVSAPPTHIYFYMNFTIHFASTVFLLLLFYFSSAHSKTNGPY